MPPTPACWAPFASMHLDPRGVVRACCMNHYQPLGRIGEQPLREIWAGASARELRRRVGAGDLSLGCELCAARVAAGSEEEAYLHVFDHLGPRVQAPTWPAQLELALTNACNLQCVMCNGELSSAIRRHREHRPPLPAIYDDGFFAELDEFLPHLESVVILGGEPLLGAESLRVLERLVQRGLRPRVHLTTNGTLWSERVERIVTSLPIHVAISIDGATADTTAAIRVGADHDLVLRNAAALRDATRANGSDCSVSFSLQRRNVHELGEVLLLADTLDLAVHVNLVAYPPEHSLLTMGTVALARVVDDLEAQATRWRSALDRNRDCWSQTVDLLARAVADQRRVDERSRAAPVAIRPTPVARARAVAEEAADHRGVATIDCDVHQLITAIAPDPACALGMDLRQLVGGPIADLPHSLRAAFGTTVATAVEHEGSGVEVRHIDLAGSDGTTRVTATMAQLPGGGQRWHLAARPLGPGG